MYGAGGAERGVGARARAAGGGAAGGGQAARGRRHRGQAGPGQHVLPPRAQAGRGQGQGPQGQYTRLLRGVKVYEKIILYFFSRPGMSVNFGQVGQMSVKVCQFFIYLFIFFCKYWFNFPVLFVSYLWFELHQVSKILHLVLKIFPGEHVPGFQSR